jgi:hypothetical protein
MEAPDVIALLTENARLREELQRLRAQHHELSTAARRLIELPKVQDILNPPERAPKNRIGF